MARRGIVVRWTASVYLLAGITYCVALDHARLGGRWAERVLGDLEVTQPLSIARVERLSATQRGSDVLELALSVRDPDGERFEFKVAGPPWEAPLRPWNHIRVALGNADVSAGTAVFSVETDGTVARESHPLSAEEGRDGLLVFLHEGRDNHWFAFAYMPQDGEHSSASTQKIGSAIRMPLPKPTTRSSQRKRAAARLVLVPLAVTIDVVTWPLQLVMLGYTMTRVPVH